jgi:tripartite-type tricarboxylate transporter receptor subunit TctC
MKDFVPVAKLAEVSFMVMAHPDVPAKNLQELIALAKAQPDKLTIATDGQRRFSGMIVSWINKLAGVQILQVPYTAQRQGVQDALGGTVNLIILAVPAARGHIQNGKLRALATTALKRLPEFPDVPAISEMFPGFDFTGWMLLAAPTGTPAPVVERMNREVNAVLGDAAVQKQLRGMGFSIQGGTQQDARDYVNAQHAAWGKVVQEIGVKPE